MDPKQVFGPFKKLHTTIIPKLVWQAYSAFKTTIFTNYSQNYFHSRVPTDIDRRSKNLRHFDPGMGLKLGVLGFSRDQNNRDSSGAYVLRSEREDKHAWNAAWCAKFVGAFCLRLFPRAWSAKTRYPQFELHGGDAITRSGIGVLGSPVYICEGTPKYLPLFMTFAVFVTLSDTRA